MRAVETTLAASLLGTMPRQGRERYEQAWMSRRGQARWSPVLVQRAASEDPRWTRAVGDHLARPQGS